MLKILSLILSFLFMFPYIAYSADNSAACAIVIDASTKTILYKKNIYGERAIASTKKIMTALLAIESGRLDETVRISSKMVAVEGFIPRT
ncbi:MAG: hypothetical protein LUG95_03470 [Clostridiales bacterium]|nr:hypothetical protein [Clostridiales bacterium]